MTDDRSSIDERAQGGEFGDFDEILEEQDYPMTADEVIRHKYFPPSYFLSVED